MKKIVMSLCVAAACVSAQTYALECSDIYGVWQGNLGSLTSVSLNIHASNPMEDASIYFVKNDGTKVGFGMMTGTCQKNADGTLTVAYSRSAYGVNASLSARAISASQLQVSSFSFSMPFDSGSGSGTLSK